MMIMLYKIIQNNKEKAYLSNILITSWSLWEYSKYCGIIRVWYRVTMQVNKYMCERNTYFIKTFSHLIIKGYNLWHEFYKKNIIFRWNPPPLSLPCHFKEHEFSSNKKKGNQFLLNRKYLDIYFLFCTSNDISNFC